MTGNEATMTVAQREEPAGTSVTSLFPSFLRLGLTAFGGHCCPADGAPSPDRLGALLFHNNVKRVKRAALELRIDLGESGS